MLLNAFEAEVGVASSILFTDDVVGWWSPIASVSGLIDLADLADVRDTAFPTSSSCSEDSMRWATPHTTRKANSGASN